MSTSESGLKQALAMARQGHFQQAQAHLKALLQENPNDGKLWHYLGLCALQTGDPDQAKQYFEKALHLMPTAAQTLFELGQILQRHGAWSEAVAHYYRAWQVRPGYWKASFQGCDLLLSCGDSETAVDWLAEVVRQPYCPEHPWRLLCFYLLACTTDARRIQQAFEGWEQRFMRPCYPEAPQWSNLPHPQRRLKIGYLSADFSLHSATNTYSALFEHADLRQFELHAFYTRAEQTSSTGWFRSHVSGWHSVHTYTPEELALYIRLLEIDILVDLSGGTSDDLKVLALQPAPLQLTGLGFGFTTGLKCLQGRFSDPVLTPPANPGWNSEPLIYLTQVFHWFPHGLHQRARLTPPPSSQQPTFTVGCGNNPFKFSRHTLETWAELLAQEPRIRLHLKFSGLEQPAVRQFFQQRLERCGIPVDKVILSGHSSLWEHLQFYNSLDLALDPFPYNGGVSTCEALWMGVPVVSLSGGTRTGASILNALQLTQWLTATPAEYIRQALELLHDLPTRQFWRTELRTRLQTSILCDGVRFTREVEAHYRLHWKNWCQASGH
jgi:protein O-GlcNAc transferase